MSTESNHQPKRGPARIIRLPDDLMSGQRRTVRVSNDPSAADIAVLSAYINLKYEGRKEEALLLSGIFPYLFSGSPQPEE